MMTSAKFQTYLKGAGWNLEYVESNRRPWMLSHTDRRMNPMGFPTIKEVWGWWNIYAPMAFQEAASARSLMQLAHSKDPAVREGLKTWALSGNSDAVGKSSWADAYVAYETAKIHPRMWRSYLVKQSLGELVCDLKNARQRRWVLDYIEQVERDELKRGIPRSKKAGTRPICSGL